ncbi:PQ loop repeat protein [Rutstroemia sp. NJR-2017a BVV2]|nr:PQ loop repeat protein [Rutstroemia sp. NJR-2017a BVV2]
MGVLSTVLLSAGVVRHYFDIYIHRTVRGISFIFVGIDAAGDVFSLVSVFFQSRLDILGLVIYSTEFILWCGVFACGGYFNLLPWIKSRTRKVSEDDSRDPDAAATHANAVQIEEGISNDIELDRIDSAGSRTVFRTPGSIASADNIAR